jgi:hypothetical protein
MALAEGAQVEGDARPTVNRTPQLPHIATIRRVRATKFAEDLRVHAVGDARKVVFCGANYPPRARRGKGREIVI